MSDETSVSRPVFVTIVGALYAVAGFFALVSGILILAGFTVEGELEIGTAASISMFIAAIISFVIAYGMLKGWKIMWYLGLICAVLGAIVSLVLIITIVMIIPLIINILIIYYLFRPGVKAFFKI